MQYDKPLSNLYTKYRSGNLTREKFEGSLFRYLLGNFERYHLFDGDRERWDEFLSWLYPRLKRAIDLYKDIGSSFDAYINGLVHNASREYRFRESAHHTMEYACWQAKAEEMELYESEPEYPVSRKGISIPRGIRPQQILYLALKSYHFIPDEKVKGIAELIGIKEEMLLNMLDEIRDLRSEKDAKFREFSFRIHSQHYRCLAFQKRMNSAEPGTGYHERMKSCFERATQRFLSMKKRLGRMRMNASNRMVAEILGIPKGTVDSGLFAIRKHLAPYLLKKRK